MRSKRATSGRKPERGPKTGAPASPGERPAAPGGPPGRPWGRRDDRPRKPWRRTPTNIGSQPNQQPPASVGHRAAFGRRLAREMSGREMLPSGASAKGRHGRRRSVPALSAMRGLTTDSVLYERHSCE